jgi:hypothetical protein
VAAVIDSAILGDLAPPTQLPSLNFIAVSATSVTTKPVFARVDYSSLLAHVRCGATLTENVASLVNATQHIAAAVTRQIQRVDFMSSTLPRPPAAAASRPQTGVANGRSLASAHAAASNVRPQTSSQVRPASASISHLLSQPASFSSFVKEARRLRYEDAASAAVTSATPLPTSRPRTSQQVTFQPSVLAGANQLESALAANILRYRGIGAGNQPAAAVGSANLASLASKGHPPAPGAAQRLNRPRDSSPRSAFIDASRPPAPPDAARFDKSAEDRMQILPQPPSEKPAVFRRAPARRVVANSSPPKQAELKRAVGEVIGASVPSVSAGVSSKKKVVKARKRAPVTVEVPSSDVNVFSLDNATALLNSGALLKSRKQTR